MWGWTESFPLPYQTRYADLEGTQKIGFSQFIYFNGLATHIQHQDGNGNLLADYAYVYDSFDKLLSATINGQTINYSYDANGQLTSDGTNNYSYDHNGNRTMPGYLTGANNRLLSDGIWDYAYDNEGNVISKTHRNTGERWAFAYDPANRLTEADQFDQNGALLQHVAYQYDAFGLRLAKTVTTYAEPGVPASAVTTTTRFAYNDNSNVWADLLTAAQLAQHFVP